MTFSEEKSGLLALHGDWWVACRIAKGNISKPAIISCPSYRLKLLQPHSPTQRGEIAPTAPSARQEQQQEQQEQKLENIEREERLQLEAN